MSRILQTIPISSSTNVGRPLTSSAIGSITKAPTDLSGKLQANDTGYFSGIGDRTGSEQVAGAKKIASSVVTGSQDVTKGIDTAKKGGFMNTIKGIGKGIQGLAEGAFGTITGAAQSTLAPITAAVSPIIKAETPLIIKTLRATHPQIAKAYDALAPEVQKTLAPKLQEISNKHPNATTLVGDIVNTLLLGVGGGEAQAPIKEALTKESLAAGKESLLEAGTAAKGKIVSATTPKTTTQVAEKALSLNEKELSGVDKTKLKYLTTKGFDMIKTEGGIFKTKMFKMTDQVKNLAKEFSHVLTGKTAEENAALVQKELGRLQKVSKDAFNGVNKTINKNTLVSGIKKAIGDMSDSVYEGYTKEQQAAFTDKRISDFLSHVKTGDLKGLDDALESFRSANVKADATISKAADTTYQAVKKYIVDNLPTEKAAIYKAANQSQAKLFDVAEILKGKIKASVGDLSKTGKALKYAAGAIGIGAVGEGIRKVTGF